ncbi:hypothetical protein [Yeosuana marina]|uniref:hypothetical protein n=1 Tax=Yeosuana marina TaxID=1565536 RepID=UPI00141F919E|nr:hypothetical protein [Yeosuana marina]
MNTKITSIKFLSLVLTLFFAVSFGFGQSQIIISQYIETSFGSTPKGIEIYNISGSDITFSGTNNLQVYVGRNGYPCADGFPGAEITSGTLRANEVWVIGTKNLTDYAIANGTNLSDIKEYGFDFNGNDALQLYLGGVLQDAFGTCGDDPITAWSGGGVSTEGNNLQIINGLCDGDTAGWTDPSTRFTQIADGQNMIGFGNAPAACCLNSSTWTAGGWIPSPPTANTSVTIDADYDTATYGSFSACSLTVNSGATLSINDVINGALSNTFIEVQNDVVVDGAILVNPQAAFVQVNDDATVSGAVLTTPNLIQVEKLTAATNAWYEYTYWSSPVFEPQIQVALSDANPTRIFSFNAQNYLDVKKETNNDGTASTGQDGIDDNGDDWQLVSGTDVMKRGVGYAATLSEFAYSTAPGTSDKHIKFTFSGPFNNGVISVPIYRNDSEKADENFNFIGNPYPSAIDANSFLAANTVIATNGSGTDINGNPYTNGAIYLWSQNTPPSSIANGNEDRNFSDSDYAIINGMGGVAGGDGEQPNDFIPSGQGFFITMSDLATPVSTTPNTEGQPIAKGYVTFNNSMRVKGASDNSQFFKNSNTKSYTSTSTINKLWVNLTSDNGVFNQTLIGYTKGATNNYDGAYFDAEKNSSSKAAILYSTIEGSNKVFAIQGKSESSLNEDEIINLGFSTQIDVPTLYTLSIAKLQGDFLSTNTIYVLDNLTNILHDLSTSDYTFTSDVGEFNDRFQIVFKASNTLSTADVQLDNSTVKILQIDDTHVSFKASNNLNIKTVTIFDLLGRQLYQLKGSHNIETYKLANLKNAVFIAKIELSNGSVITKKAIKK